MSSGLHIEKKPKQLNTNKPFVLAAIILAMFMSAIEATIVSTAMPNIAADLGGFSLYSWIFSSYLLMQSATVLIYGKLSDLYGRKPVFVVGVSIFLVGSLLCGFATSMKMLVFFRFVQGFGAGSVMTIASTIVGDMYTKEERSQIQGYLSSVWGISAVLGPALGAFFVQFVNWQFVFWMNIPLGILSILGVLFFLHENVEVKKEKINLGGSLLMAVTISSLMVILVEGGVRWEWLSLPILSLFSLVIIGTLLFVMIERRAKQPMMHFNLWRNRAIAVSNSASFTTGIILFGVSSFLPTYVQGVMEYSPFIAGLTLTTMSVGWPIAATVAGKLLLKIGYKKTSILGGIFLVIGGIVFSTLSPERGPFWAGAGSFLIGLGMGFTITSFIVSIQSAVDWKQRGIATATNNFMRQIGSTIGVALFGGILNSQLFHYFSNKNLPREITLDSTNALLNIEERTALSLEMKKILQEGLSVSLHSVYMGVFFVALISLAIVIFMPVTDKQQG